MLIQFLLCLCDMADLSAEHRSGTTLIRRKAFGFQGGIFVGIEMFGHGTLKTLEKASAFSLHPSWKVGNKMACSGHIMYARPSVRPKEGILYCRFSSRILCRIGLLCRASYHSGRHRAPSTTILLVLQLGCWAPPHLLDQAR